MPPGRSLVAALAVAAGPALASAPALSPILPAALPSVAAAQAGAPTRERALADLARPDRQVRRRAVVRLAEIGTMDDAPALVQALRDPDQLVRALSERALWQVWSRSGDAEVDALFERGLEQMKAGAADAAIATFSGVIGKKPEFAEGWNKRATLYYLVGEYAKSLADCDEVVKRNPSHFGALSGYGQIYLKLDQPEKALDYFERALAVNPNMEQVQAVIGELRALVREKRKRSI
jgi:tetratricopeptide (TPR) repeat protein